MLLIFSVERTKELKAVTEQSGKEQLPSRIGSKRARMDRVKAEAGDSGVIEIEGTHFEQFRAPKSSCQRRSASATGHDPNSV